MRAIFAVSARGRHFQRGLERRILRVGRKQTVQGRRDIVLGECAAQERVLPGCIEIVVRIRIFSIEYRDTNACGYLRLFLSMSGCSLKS